MEREITPELTKAFTRRAATRGYKIRQEFREGDTELQFTAYMDRAEICEFEKSGAVRFMPDNPFVSERKELQRLLLDMKQAHDLYADASPLELAGLSDFRVISQFGDVLLAAKMGKDYEVRFNTWKYDYDRTGVTWGHYYDTDYEGAKLDFAVRAGLIDKNRYFTNEEVMTLRGACVFRGRNDDELSCGDEKRLQTVMEKLDESLPIRIYYREQSEQEDSHGIQPD